MKQALVTGGAGFIGSHLVDALVSAGVRVRVLDDLSTGRRSNLSQSEQSITFLLGSILDRQAVADAVQGCDVVYHLAALPSVARSLILPLATHEVCATGTLVLLEAARQAQVGRFIYAGSSSAYGGAAGPIRRESDPPQPLSPYAVAKWAGEEYCRIYASLFGLPTLRLRFFNVFGPRQMPDSPYAGVIPKFISMMQQGQKPLIFGDGEQTRDFTYVADVVAGLLLAGTVGKAEGQVLNLGAGRAVSLLTLVRTLNDVLGTALVPQHQEGRLGDVRHSQADISQAARELGFTPQVSLRDGLERTVAALREWGISTNSGSGKQLQHSAQ